jgi:hypothetical protein
MKNEGMPGRPIGPLVKLTQFFAIEYIAIFEDGTSDSYIEKK